MDRMAFRPEKSGLTTQTSPGTEWPVRIGWSITDAEQREAGELIGVYSKCGQDEAGARQWAGGPRIRRLWTLCQGHQCSRDGEELQGVRKGVRAHIANNPLGTGANQAGRSLAIAGTGP